MLIVNLFGAPGAGKSTGAAYVFAKLKMAGVNAELVTEFAKDKVWDGGEAAFENQAYIFGEQYYRISRLRGRVDVVVTDSPLLLSPLYNKETAFDEELDALVTKVANSYTSFNAFIDRSKPYNPAGRLHTEAESDAISQTLIDFLESHGVIYKRYPGLEEGYDALVADIFNKLNQIIEVRND